MENAESLGADPKRVIIGGGSAGANVVRQTSKSPTEKGI
jgi:acetyl esterase/lipase